MLLVITIYRALVFAFAQDVADFYVAVNQAENNGCEESQHCIDQGGFFDFAGVGQGSRHRKSHCGVLEASLDCHGEL